MSLKLQVFKTHNRGWGIRCLNDVPQGSFICIYAGTIHTEQMANEVSRSTYKSVAFYPVACPDLFKEEKLLEK